MAEITVDSWITVSGFLEVTKTDLLYLPHWGGILTKGFKVYVAYKVHMKKEQHEAAEKAAANERERKLEEQVRTLHEIRVVC